MKKLLVSLLLLLFCLPFQAQNYVKTGQGMKVTTQGMLVEVEFYSPSIVRIYKTPEGVPYAKKSLVVTRTPERTPIDIVEDKEKVMLVSSALRLEVNLITGGIGFYNKNGDLLLKDKDYGTVFMAKDDAGTPSYQVRGSFMLDKDEAIYGVGQTKDGKLNRRNSIHHLQNENTLTYSPYFMSVKGYGVYWDNYSISDFVDTPQELAFYSLGHCADYYFMYGGNADGVIADIRHLTGKAPMLPLWSYGFFQSRERYCTQDESLEVLKKFRELQIPVDCMIQDWRYWSEYKNDSTWNSHSFDPERFPDPKKWADEIHKLNAKLLVVAWPGFGPKTEQYKELDAKKMMIHFDTWPPNSGTCPYDPYNPEALNIYWKYLDKGIFSYIGNDGWWLDSTEPDHINVKPSDFDLPTHLGSYRSVKNAFSLMHNSGIATHQKAQNKDKRVLILTRSGFIGQQRYGSNTWSGDLKSSWEVLTNQIPAALNFSMMGIPNWNSDIGGFWAFGGTKDPAYQDLYVRWMQFGAFCPMMRSHGTTFPREIWQFGKRGEWCFDAQERIINLRYRLLPYIYSTSWEVSAQDGTFMRALVMDFAADKKTHNIGGEYLFGRSILVAPVTKPDVEEWETYLPQGTDWWSFWTNEKVSGGQTVACKVTKDILPLYIKAGTILPFGPKVQYATEKKWDELEIRIYPGADGTFVLYEDENDNYNYENGAYSTIPFHWDEAEHVLMIGSREGKFKGMLEKRKFKIVLMGNESVAGDQSMVASKVISYSGRGKCVSLNLLRE